MGFELIIPQLVNSVMDHGGLMVAVAALLLVMFGFGTVVVKVVPSSFRMFKEGCEAVSQSLDRMDATVHSIHGSQTAFLGIMIEMLPERRQELQKIQRRHAKAARVARLPRAESRLPKVNKKAA